MTYNMKLGCPYRQKSKKKKKNQQNNIKKNESQFGLILQIYYMGYEIGVTLLKTNPKNKEARFLIKQTLRDEIEKKNQLKKVGLNST